MVNKAGYFWGGYVARGVGWPAMGHDMISSNGKLVGEGHISMWFSLPEAELKRVLGEGGVHGLEEVGKRGQEIGECWRELGRPHISSTGCSKNVGSCFIDCFLRIGESNIHQ